MQDKEDAFETSGLVDRVDLGWGLSDLIQCAQKRFCKMSSPFWVTLQKMKAHPLG